MNVFKSVKTAAIAAVVSIGMAGAAIAAPITGSIDITGGIASITESGVTPGTLSAVTFDGNGEVEQGTGAFAGLVGNTNVIMTDLTAPFTQTVWSVGGFSFEITSVLLNTFTPLTNTGALGTLFAVGILSADGFEDTEGLFSLTANTLGATASFSSSTTNVPLPASVLLLGGALVGMGAAARRRKKLAAAA